MALPVIPNIYRCSINGDRAGGVAPVNVLHISADGLDESDVGDSIWHSFQENQFGVVSGEFVAESIDILKLDGSSPTVRVSVPGDVDPTDFWGPTGEQWSPADAAVISLRTSVRGPRGRGRQFLGPLREAAMEDGFLAGSGVSSLGVAWADFGASLASNDTPLVVASYVHADAHLVTNLHADAGLGTCRRRLLQQR